MLSRTILLCYNQMFATSILYLTLMDPLNEVAKSLIGSRLISYNHQIIGSVFADAVQNYYDTLGVKRAATKHEIHKAFRQMAKKYHPDKNKDGSAQDEFIKVFKAYETLSDEKKRKEYDEQLDGQANHHKFTGDWQQTTTTTNMNDFDINDFFKQYEDQFLKHAQHFGHHNQQHNSHHFNSQHDKFTFHGVNLDDLFHDIDEDEYNSFGHFDISGHNTHHNFDHNYHQQEAVDGFFGDGASFFGQHFTHQIHDTLHQFQHHQAHYGGNHHQHRNYHSCQTTTKQVNGMIMTQTSCA